MPFSILDACKIFLAADPSLDMLFLKNSSPICHTEIGAIRICSDEGRQK